MIVDCMTCPVRGKRCDDCVVTLLRAPGSFEPLPMVDLGLSTELPLDAAEHRAVSLFVDAGLVSYRAAARLGARRESVQSWGTVRNVG